MLKKDAVRNVQVHLKATNGEIIASSEAYERKASAPNGIESVRKNAAIDEIDDQTGT